MADNQSRSGSARQTTVNELTQRREAIEAQKRKGMFREQIIFILIALMSISPIVAAFMVEDSDLAMKLFIIGGAAMILLYPSYLIIRSILGAAMKAKAK